MYDWSFWTNNTNSTTYDLAIFKLIATKITYKHKIIDICNLMMKLSESEKTDCILSYEASYWEIFVFGIILGESKKSNLFLSFFKYLKGLKSKWPKMMIINGWKFISLFLFHERSHPHSLEVFLYKNLGRFRNSQNNILYWNSKVHVALVAFWNAKEVEILRIPNAFFDFLSGLKLKEHAMKWGVMKCRMDKLSHHITNS